MSGDVVVIGIGNDFRRDDGVGLAVADEIAKRRLPGVRVIPRSANRASFSKPGPACRSWSWWTPPWAKALHPAGFVAGRPATTADPGVVSSHALGLPQAYALGQALGQIPEKLVVFSVDVADTSHGVTLTPAVAAAVPDGGRGHTR